MSTRETALDSGYRDIDTTIKVLYGKQEGATVAALTPQKSGRPSHAYHSYVMSGLRLVLDVKVSPGDQMNARHALPGLSELLERLPEGYQPWLVREDCAFGNEPTLEVLEQRSLSNLFKLRLTKNVRKLIRDLFWRAFMRALSQNGMKQSQSGNGSLRGVLSADRAAG